MAKIIIDCGTTNSRLRLTTGEEEHLTDIIKLEAGIRNAAIDGNKDKLIKALQEGIQMLLHRNNLTASDVTGMAASGMITSNIGLHEVPHVKAPAGLMDFVQNADLVRMEEFLHIPCLFIPGMKTESEVINDSDVMRGEEVETFGLLKMKNPSGAGLVILPGSHTKFVFVNEERQLTSSYTTLAGELLKAVQSETILADSLETPLIQSFIPDDVERGFEAAEEFGVTRALFHIRLLHLRGIDNANQRANYLAGVIFYEDVKALQQQLTKYPEMKWVMVGGSAPLKNIFIHLLKKIAVNLDIVEVEEDVSEQAAFQGAIEIIRAIEEE